MILVVSHDADDHADRVLAELDRRGHPSVLFDTGAFPGAIGVAERFGGGPPSLHATVDRRRVDLAECGAVWWRRPRPHVLDPALDPDAATFAYCECREALEGLWSAVPATWVNDRVRDEEAHHKPYQLAVATDVGLPVPATLVTNVPEEARAFAAANGPGRTVYKTFLATERHWRETRVLRDGEVALLDRVRLAPVIFQALVPALADLRVTVIGDDVFAAEVPKSPDTYPVDYRMSLDRVTFRRVRLPDEVESRIHALLARLGLRYGAVDLLRTGEGYVFLEVNPAGEFLFVEDRSGIPLAAAMASYLAGLDGGA